MVHVYTQLVVRGKFSWQQLWYGQLYSWLLLMLLLLVLMFAFDILPIQICLLRMVEWPI
jgi:hypothetical protein